MREERVFIPFEDYEIPGVYAYPDTGKEPYRAVLFLHGFLAYKEGDGFLFQKLAAVLAKAGIASLRIDFCSMGENRKGRQFYGMKQLLKETKRAYEAMKENPCIDTEHIGLVGHSMGGRVAILSAGLNPKLIVTLNGAVMPEMVSVKNVDEEKMNRDGFVIASTSDGRRELLFPVLLSDTKECNANKDIYQYRGPVLVAIGDKDPTVLPIVGETFYEKLENPHKAKLVITDANHTFNAKTRDYTKVYELGEKLATWLKETL